jgi:GTPase SAR1 family protein
MLIIVVVAIVIAFDIFVVIPISALFSIGHSVTCVIKAIASNINPYRKYIDRHKNAPKGVRRNYFFGPGFFQVKQIVHDSFQNLKQASNSRDAWYQSATLTSSNAAYQASLFIGYTSASICTSVLGAFWCFLFAICLYIIIFLCMILFYIYYTMLLGADSVTLLLRSIHSRCPHCKERNFIPVFRCPTCNLPHRSLVPGPYGVIYRKCACGQKLATTFSGGRYRYQAECKRCGTELYSTNAKQYGIQLVGGIGSGKTTFLSAFCHEYKAWLNTEPQVKHNVIPKDAFQDLDDLFNSGIAEHTLETNGNMYSIIHKLSKRNIIQMSIYDIAGEVFDYSESEVQQLQFDYCEGIILVIDSTDEKAEASRIIGNFINRLDALGNRRSSKMRKVPIAIIISKADLFKKELGIPKIKALYKSKQSTAGEPVEYWQIQNEVCREFLINRGQKNSINLLESKFEEIHYFPVSAMGHEMNRDAYEPWGVLEPVFWLMHYRKCPLKKMVLDKE